MIISRRSYHNCCLLISAQSCRQTELPGLPKFACTSAELLPYSIGDYSEPPRRGTERYFQFSRDKTESLVPRGQRFSGNGVVKDTLDSLSLFTSFRSMPSSQIPPSTTVVAVVVVPLSPSIAALIRHVLSNIYTRSQKYKALLTSLTPQLI